MQIRLFFLALPLFPGVCFAADLTGNWVVANPGNDGVTRKTFFDLKQEARASRATSAPRSSTMRSRRAPAAPDGFTIVGSMMDGHKRAHRQIQGKLQGDELHMAAAPARRAPAHEMVAHRAPGGRRGLPERIAPPALHKVPDNGLAKTPPMGWNSWNKFAGRVDDAVRARHGRRHGVAAA